MRVDVAVSAATGAPRADTSLKTSVILWNCAIRNWYCENNMCEGSSQNCAGCLILSTYRVSCLSGAAVLLALASVYDARRAIWPLTLRRYCFKHPGESLPSSPLLRCCTLPRLTSSCRTMSTEAMWLLEVKGWLAVSSTSDPSQTLSEVLKKGGRSEPPPSSTFSSAYDIISVATTLFTMPQMPIVANHIGTISGRWPTTNNDGVAAPESTSKREYDACMSSSTAKLTSPEPLL